MIKKIWQKIIDWLDGPFPNHYPPECFMCNLGKCKGCEIYEDWRK